MSVLIVTSPGDIVIDLHTDMCPLTSKNFLKICKEAKVCHVCLQETGMLALAPDKGRGEPDLIGVFRMCFFDLKAGTLASMLERKQCRQCKTCPWWPKYIHDSSPNS